MYRVTTPRHTFKLPVDTGECTAIQVTYKQDGRKLIKHYKNGQLPPGMTLSGNKVVIRLTQEETKSFHLGFVDVHLRALINNGDAEASEHYKVAVEEVNDDEVLV